MSQIRELIDRALSPTNPKFRGVGFDPIWEISVGALERVLEAYETTVAARFAAVAPDGEQARSLQFARGRITELMERVASLEKTSHPREQARFPVYEYPACTDECSSRAPGRVGVGCDCGEVKRIYRRNEEIRKAFEAARHPVLADKASGRLPPINHPAVCPRCHSTAHNRDDLPGWKPVCPVPHAKSCEGCGCDPCVPVGGECPGKMQAPVTHQWDSEIESTATADHLLHRLWSKAVGTPHYIKAEWLRLEVLLRTTTPPQPVSVPYTLPSTPADGDVQGERPNPGVCRIGDCDGQATVCQVHHESAYAEGTADMTTAQRELDRIRGELAAVTKTLAKRDGWIAVELAQNAAEKDGNVSARRGLPCKVPDALRDHSEAWEHGWAVASTAERFGVADGDLATLRIDLARSERERQEAQGNVARWAASNEGLTVDLREARAALTSVEKSWQRVYDLDVGRLRQEVEAARAAVGREGVRGTIEDFGATRTGYRVVIAVTALPAFFHGDTVTIAKVPQ